MKKISVMHILPSLEVGGMEKGVVNVVNGLDRSRFRPFICCLEKEGALRANVKEDVKVFNFNQPPGVRFFLPFWLQGLFRREKVDIVHTHNFYTSLYGIIAARLARVPVVIHGEHGLMLQDRPRRKRIGKILYNFADVILTVSENLKHMLVNDGGMRRDKVFAVLNGIDLKKFDMILKQQEMADNEKNNLIIGTVGRLVPVKDYPTLLKAFSIIHSAFPQAQLIFVGDGPLKGKLQSIRDSLNLKESVRFLGQREDVHELYRRMRVFVLCSLSEGMSNVILEAMASRLPVVATAVGDNPLLVDNGKTGILVTAEKPQELAQAIISILADANKAEEMGKAGYARVKERFGLEEMISGYEKVYAHLVGKKGVGRS